ncbi:uncharacterized protein LOC101863566 isoform X1 [Aplysia californica]|uniref:Uncharacterized protein LOC101863566 isoform X1 n=1 Tax=Aplysia californica TaxID=6500 RepID=A0ABM0JEG1_APLCA|nr:uncharacterized protein LOC101863566 isoform X1 [Aplysia californica]
MDSGPLDWPVGDRRSGDIHLPFIADLYDITTGRTSTRHGVHSLPPALSQLDNSVGHIKDRLRLLAREKMEVSEARELLNHDREMQNRLYQTEMQRMTQRFDKERKHTQALRAAHQEEVERARRRLRAEQMETLNVKSYYFFVTPSLTLRWLIQQGIKWLYWICHGDFRTHWISTLAKYDQSLFDLMRNKTDQQKQ